MKKIIIAPDSFKGSLSAQRFCELAQAVIARQIPTAEVIALPLSDGGEGFVDSFVQGNLASRCMVTVQDPLARPTTAEFAWQESTKTAIVEMAQASGLTKLQPSERNPLQTHTFGCGQIINKALEQGAKKIVLGLGGSATNDGGVGALRALGIQVNDGNGNSVQLGGQGLSHIAQISDIPLRLREIEWVIASDVTNPLLGEHGATAVFGPQKGLQPQHTGELENGLANWAEKIQQHSGVDVTNLPGAGAAGGMAAGFIGLLGAKVQPGFNVLNEYLAIDRVFTSQQPISLVITGEGRIDRQTAFGKLPLRIAKMAKSHSIPCVGICGSLGVKLTDLPYFTALFSIVNSPMSEYDAMLNAERLLTECIENIISLMSLHN